MPDPIDVAIGKLAADGRHDLAYAVRRLQLAAAGENHRPPTPADGFKHSWLAAERMIRLLRARLEVADVDIAAAKAEVSESFREACLTHREAVSAIAGLWSDREALRVELAQVPTVDDGRRIGQGHTEDPRNRCDWYWKVGDQEHVCDEGCTRQENLTLDLEHQVDVSEDDDDRAFGECRACCWSIGGSLARVEQKADEHEAGR